MALTGRYPFRTGHISNKSAMAVDPSHETMMPVVLKKAGYVTAHCGKWGQIRRDAGTWGFDEYLEWARSGCYWREQQRRYSVNGKEVDLPEGKYLPDLMHDFCVEFINRHKDRPFYLHYSLAHMHGPIVRTPDSAPGEKQRGKGFYADNIAYMDKLVGKLVDELDRLKLRENTLIVFTGDNGSVQHGTLNGGRAINGNKGALTEGGCRVPLIANWLGTTPTGKVSKDLTDFSDFFPTFAELGGAPLPKGVTIDGQSFAAQIKGETGTPREWVYMEYRGESFARNARWKLTNNGELFDLSEAPFAEKPVPADTTDPGAIAGRKSLQAVLDKHPAAPFSQTKKGEKGDDEGE
jgi:arylsulfatase A